MKRLFLLIVVMFSYIVGHTTCNGETTAKCGQNAYDLVVPLHVQMDINFKLKDCQLNTIDPEKRYTAKEINAFLKSCEYRDTLILNLGPKENDRASILIKLGIQEFCNEDVVIFEECPEEVDEPTILTDTDIPTMGEWGLICLVLLFLILGTVAIKNRDTHPMASSG